MARTSTALVAVTLALILAGCSSPATTTGAKPAGSTPAVTSSTTTTGSAKTGKDGVDCTALSGEAGGTFLIGIQVLAQLTTQDTVDTIKAGTLNYDPDAMSAILAKLKTLTNKSILGDPQAAVVTIGKANDQARAILAVSGPVKQSMFDDMKAIVVDPGTFLSKQTAIDAAYSSACG
jgi:PBP1b-binding outer membrane lipoprotein LpoB